jgi:hypothetical protein
VKYSFAIAATITLTTDVEADSLEEAIEEAQSRGTQSLCHQCSTGDVDVEWSLTGEIDCDPCTMPLEDVTCDDEDIDLGEARAAWGNDAEVAGNGR